MNILHRGMVEVNTDPLRRCYDGCHFNSEFVWTAWSVLEEGIAPERCEARLEFWRSLNAYAVSQRGRSACKEFKAV